MLSDNIRELRKEKGYSQQTLAEQLNVVRQTVSKWEKGLSVPDAELLERMAELFDVPVDRLLGGSVPPEETAEKPDPVAAQLAVLNAQLAKQLAFRKKVFRTVLIVLASVVAVTVIAVTLSVASYSVVENSAVVTEEVIQTEE